MGTATDPDFLRYEVAFFQETNPDDNWIVLAQGDRPVIDNTLALWDTTVGHNAGVPVFPDGRYQLRLRVVRTDYNYDEYFVRGIVVANETSTPTPTATPDEAATAAGAPPSQATVEPLRPAVLPSLTPFPTPTRQPTVAANGLLTDGGSPTAGEASDQGWFNRLAAVELGQFRQAFWEGVRLTGIAFAGLGLYLISRNSLRWLWRRIRVWHVKRARKG